MLRSSHVASLGWPSDLDLARVTHLGTTLLNHLLQLPPCLRTHVHNLGEKHPVLLSPKTQPGQTTQHRLLGLLLSQARRSHISLHIMVKVTQMLLLDRRGDQLPGAYQSWGELIIG